MSDPTIPTPQNTGHGYSTWTSTWSDERKPGQKRGKTHCKRFGKVKEVSRIEAMRRWKRWLEKEFPEIREAQQATYSIGDLCQDFFAQMGKRYLIDGKHTTTINRMRGELESLKAMYGSHEAAATTASMILVWLEAFVRERRRVAKGKAVTPKTSASTNLGLSYIKRMYRWGAKFGKIPDTAAGSVQLVENIRADHADARKKEPIPPVSRDDIEATFAKCDQSMKDIIEVAWLSGVRPGEVVSMRGCDLATGEDVWVYTPRRHKNTWRKKVRKIAIGPKAKAIVEPLLSKQTDAPIFVNPKTKKAWTVPAFYRALNRAAKDAGVQHWHLNRIRHSYATRIEDEYGAEFVTALLGHSNDQQQRVYVERSLKKAIKVAKEVG